MGSRVRSNISKTNVSTWEEECVEYKTPDSTACTISAKAKVDSASITLRDYTFERTTLDITVGRGRAGVGIVNVKYDANVLNVSRDQDEFAFVYGVPDDRVCVVSVEKVDGVGTHGSVLTLTHIQVAPTISAVGVLVWYDRGKGRFRCYVEGPLTNTSWYFKLSDAARAMSKNYPSAIGGVADTTTGHQTTMTALINNTGHVRGRMNGSIILNYGNIYT